jgi:hypothetical protein
MDILLPRFNDHMLILNSRDSETWTTRVVPLSLVGETLRAALRRVSGSGSIHGACLGAPAHLFRVPESVMLTGRR